MKKNLLLLLSCGLALSVASGCEPSRKSDDGQVSSLKLPSRDGESSRTIKVIPAGEDFFCAFELQSESQEWSVLTERGFSKNEFVSRMSTALPEKFQSSSRYSRDFGEAIANSITDLMKLGGASVINGLVGGTVVAVAGGTGGAVIGTVVTAGLITAPVIVGGRKLAAGVGNLMNKATSESVFSKLDSETLNVLSDQRTGMALASVLANLGLRTEMTAEVGAPACTQDSESSSGPTEE